ncbi:hypothetical protein D9M70_601340 [compost metagenome]
MQRLLGAPFGDLVGVEHAALGVQLLAYRPAAHARHIGGGNVVKAPAERRQTQDGLVQSGAVAYIGVERHPEFMG